MYRGLSFSHKLHYSSIGLKRMFEGSIPSLSGANSNGEKLERTFVKHSKKILIEVPISTSPHRSMQHPTRWPLSRVQPMNRQLRADLSVKNYVWSWEPLPLVWTARACTAQKVIKSNCSPVEVHFFFFENEKSSSVHENLWDKLSLSVVLPHT